MPILENSHWTLVSIDILNQRINYYDSYYKNPSLQCCELIRNFIRHEHQRLNHLFDETSWKINLVKNLPRQLNTYDCGVFSCVYADYLSRDQPFNFDQVDKL